MSLFATTPQSLSRFILRQLYRSLPPLRIDTPEEHEDREIASMAAIARLAPANTGEALLAVQAIAAEAHASDALQSVHQHRDDFQRVSQCRAQSALMIREAMAVRKELRTMQKSRLEALLAHEEALAYAAGLLVEDAPSPDGTDPVAEPDPARPDAGDGAEISQDMGQNPTDRSRETETTPTAGPMPKGDAGLAELAAMAPPPAWIKGAWPSRHAVA